MTWKTGDADEFLEDIMTEHVCKWGWDEDADGIHFLYCYSGCTDTMFPDEILQRVNATERLSAKRALLIANAIDKLGYTIDGMDGGNSTRYLRDYADILEGKDET